jgi:hypothetical protein
VTVRLKVFLILGTAAPLVIGTLYAAWPLFDPRSLLTPGIFASQRNHGCGTSGLPGRRSKNLTAPMSICRSTTAPMTGIPKPTRKYLHSILGDGPDGWMDQQRVNFLLLVDPAGNTIYASGFDPASASTVAVPKDLQVHALRSDRLLEFQGPRDRIDGIILLSSGPVLIASRPIVHTNYAGPPRGALVTARRLDARALQRLSDKNGVPSVAAFRIDRHLPADVAKARSTPSCKRVGGRPGALLERRDG